MKTKSFIMKAVMVSLVLIFIFSVLGYAVMSKRTGYNRQADPNTMESYKDVLLSDEVNGNGSRYAGRVWADKTVQTHRNNSSTTSNSSLPLTLADDGLQGSVGYNSDFLHVFSTLGSSQVVNQYASKPIDVVLLLDISSSMTNKSGDRLTQDDPLHQVINETNTLIDQLMGNDPDLPVHSQNRVGVVVYGGGTQQLLPLGHYEANSKKDINQKQIGEYIKIIEEKANARTNPDGWVERGADTYFPTVTTNVVPNQTLAQQNISKVMIADSTYLQGALYQGMNILANEPDTTYQDKVQGKVARTPVMITLTDGATNIISATTTSKADHDNQYSWDNPYVGVIPNAGENTMYAASGANPFYADCNDGTGVSVAGGTDRNSKYNKDIEVQAISTRSVSNLLLAGYYKNKIENHYNTDMINFSIGYNVDTDKGVGPFGREQLMATLNPKEYFDESREYPNDLVDRNNESKVDLAKAEVEATRNAINKYLENKPDDLAQMRFPRDPGRTYTFVNSNLWSNFIWNHPNDASNDLKSFDDIYYVNKYYKADDTEEVSNVFKEILQLITSQTFTPIGGENDNGVKDSLTYMDPIGEYMDVKENSITTSKGTTDMAMLLFGEMHGMVRTAVYDYKFNSDPAHRIVTKDDEGWYDNETGKLIGHGETDSNWDVATYRVCGATTREYVSTLNEDEGLTPQQENTIYTLYRFTDNYTERNTPKLNPSYDEEENITYKLSDIRVWTQYTGDYIDETGSGSAIDLGYDEALYVNIPVSALPVQVAKISLDQNGNVVEGGYESNLNNKPASTPFRLFYGIGIQDAIRTEDGTKIDITKLSPEYIEKHTEHTENGDYIYFNSNYWSGSLHTHSNGEEESIGDANFSFSPNSTNRYYAFQKPLILYEDPNKDSNPESHKDVPEIGNNNYENFKSGLKTVSDVSQLDPNKYYFIQAEYYVPTDENGNAKEAHILASRKGSEFGSEIPGAEYGEYLEWYNPETGDEAPYVPGSPTGGKPVENGDKYVIATKPKGLRMGQICKQNNRKAPNTTGTAENVYLPTVSQNSTLDNTVLNGYLGNNGVLRVRDSSLEITKEVEGYLGEEDYKDEEFDFELTMPSYANESVDAICIYRNDKRTDGNSAQRWLIQPGTIDIVTTNEGFIQASEVNPELPTTLATTDDGQYYIYVGNSPDEAVYHLYDETKDKELHPEVSDTLPGVGKKEASTSDGSIEYYASVTLVPIADFEDGSYKDKLGSYEKDDNFVICKLDATKDIESQITSEKYLTRTAYKTRTLNFDGEGKAQFQLKLKDGEGILLVGLDNGTSYTIKELLTDDQIKAGYRFDHAYNNADGNVDGIVTDEDGNPSVSGTVDNSIRSRGRHFVNKYYMLNDLSVSKEVRGSDEDAENDRINETEWNFNIKLKFNDDTFIDDLANSDSIKVKYDKYKYNEEQQDYTDIVEKDGELTLNKETTGRGIYTGTFAVKHNEKITLKDILSGTEYEIKETNGYNNPDGYITTLKDKYGNVVNSPDGITGVIGKQEGDINEVDTNIQIQVVNFNPAEEDLTIEKQVKGETADYNKDWEFDLILTPPADFRFDSTYSYTKTAPDGTETNGNINIGKAEADGTYKVTVKLKHGEKIKIEGLPEGTTYKVVEKDANNNGYETDIPENAEGTLDQSEEMTFTNSLIKYYQMSLKKTVVGHNSSTTDRFKFKVTFTPSDSFGFKPINYSYPNGTPDTGRLVLPGTATEENDKELIANGDGSYYVEFDLKHNDIVYFNNIIEGTTYKVEEELSQEQSGENGYEVRKPDNADGELDQNNTNPNVEFVNIRYALNDLMISKNVEGETGIAENREFNFKITFKPAEDVEFKTSYPYEKKRGTVTSETGNLDLTDNGDGTYSANFNLRHDEHYTVKDIPERTQYWVEELDANQNGYETEITKGQDNGAYVGPNIDQDMEVEFTNRKIAYYPLTVEKVVQGDNVDTNREFRFRITLIPEEGMKEFKESYTYTGSKSGTLQFNNNNDGTYTAEVTLKGGENIKLDGIPEKTRYVVEELNANQDGYLETESNNAEGTLTGQGQVVRYTNIKMPPHSLTLSKETEGGATGNTSTLWHFEVRLTPPIGQTLDKLSYTSRNIIEGVQPYTPPEGEIQFVEDLQNPGTYVATVQLLHGQSITINDIPTGTNYKVSETEANKNSFVTYVQGDESGTITDDVGIVVAYKNKKAAPMDLMIAKTVDGNRGDKTAEWNFDIKLTPEENVNLESVYRYEGTGGKSNGLISFAKQQDGSYLGHVTLRHGETITIKGLPKGTKHEITEREANQNDYTTKVDGQTVGVLDENGKQIEFVNTKLGAYDLSIKKTVMGRLGDKTRDWRFQIVLNIPNATEPTKSYPYVRKAADGTQTTGELTFTRNALGNYEAETTLKHGDLITLQNILEGTQYTVTEPESNKDGYITNHTDNCQGTIVENGTQVEYVNRYLSTIDLTLQKVVKGEAGEYDRMWTYKITLDTPKGVVLNSSYHFSGSREGEISFTQDQNGLYTGTIQIKHGETLTIEGLPEDTKYLVEEVEANTDGYTTKDSGNTQGNLTVDTDNIVYTNLRLTNKDLSLEKIVEGRLGDKNREWTFEVILTPDEYVSLDNSYMYTGSKEGNLDLTRNPDGTYTGIIKLKHGEKVTVQGIPEGTQYRIVEKEANTEGYETTNSDNVEGKLQGDITPTVTFKNSKLLNKDLTVTKTVQGILGDKNRGWTFDIYLTPTKDLGLWTSYEYVGTNNSGTIQFVKGIDGAYIARVTLKHGEYITIKNIPEETDYKVTELEADQDGYITDVSDNYQGKITDSDIMVEYINSKHPVNQIGYRGPRVVSPRTSDNIISIIALFGLSISLIVLSVEGYRKTRKK